MKNKFSIFFLSLIVALTLSIEASAAITPGAKCSKAGVKQVYKGKTYTCVKSGKKLAWDKGVAKVTSTTTPKPSMTPTPLSSPSNPFADAVAKAEADKAEADKAAADKAAIDSTCIPGSYCPIGSTGPGGGIVFYDAGSQQSWGRYLEVAPKGWSVSVLASGVTDARFDNWCNVSNINFTTSISDVALKATLGFEIGKGKANTDLMVAFCSSGAGVLARAYKGGGKSDWFLPSKDELNELCKYAYYQRTGLSNTLCDSYRRDIRAGFREGHFWSSSESSGGFAWLQYFPDGGQAAYGKNYIAYVRAVRAF